MGAVEAPVRRPVTQCWWWLAALVGGVRVVADGDAVESEKPIHPSELSSGSAGDGTQSGRRLARVRGEDHFPTHAHRTLQNTTNILWTENACRHADPLCHFKYSRKYTRSSRNDGVIGTSRETRSVRILHGELGIERGRPHSRPMPKL